MDPLESIGDAAVRECKEETGIETEFVALSAFRESQSGPFSTSDLYYIALLKLSDKYAAAGQTRPETDPDPAEIAAAKYVTTVFVCFSLRLPTPPTRASATHTFGACGVRMGRAQSSFCV